MTRLTLALALAWSWLAGLEADAKPLDEEHTAAVFVVPAQGEMSRAREATLLLTLERTLGDYPQIDLVDVDNRLAARVGRIPAKQIADARDRLQRGTAALEQGKAKDAIANLEEAVAKLEESVAFIDLAELSQAQFTVGAALALTGEKDAAVDAFRQLATWNPTYSITADYITRDVTDAWLAAKKSLARKRKGTLKLVSEPAGAIAYVDGRFIGFTPTRAEGLLPGVHHVTYKMHGFYRVAQKGEVRSRKTSKVTATLEPAEQAEQVKGLARAVASTLESDTGPRALLDLRDLLDVDHAIFIRVPGRGQDKAPYQAAVFDTETRARLSLVSAPPDDDVQTLLETLTRSLYGELIPTADPIVETSGDKGDKGDKGGKRFYQKWWFWTGLAVTTVAGVGVPLLFKYDVIGGDNGPCPSGFTCGDISWRF